MKTAIAAGLTRVSTQFSWATVGDGILFTAQVRFDDAARPSACGIGPNRDRRRGDDG